jgi:4-hydroxybenzoate polyprenyltransferase
MRETLKAYIDLTRLHFFFVWPILFCSGLFLAFQYYDSFSWSLVIRALLIGLLGFEAGFVLNDIIDRDLDKRDIEFDTMTKYWRVFGKKPLSQGLISLGKALKLFIILVILTTILILTLSFPQSIYVMVIMIYCYSMEYFYQVKKRNQTFPISQLVGRTDFTLFPIAGYLCVGNPDINVLLFALFFYPLALAHLGINDIIDVENDRVKELNTIPVLYGMKGTTYWILFFSIIHFGTAILFLNVLGNISLAGFTGGFLLLSVANYIILKGKSVQSGMKALPLFHVAMLIYAISNILDYLI